MDTVIPKEIDGIPVFAFTIDKMDYQYGFRMMSFVDDPAVEKAFIALNKEPKLIKLSINEEKRLVTGVAMRANFPIYRISDEGKEYYFYVSAEELELMVEKFMAEKKTDLVNLHHDPHKQVSGVFLYESFFLNEHNKQSYPEFSDVEDGSWMVTYKVRNDDVWSDIKAGKLKGFSVEMLGDLSNYNLQKTNQELAKWIREATDALRAINYKPI